LEKQCHRAWNQLLKVSPLSPYHRANAELIFHTATIRYTETCVLGIFTRPKSSAVLQIDAGSPEGVVRDIIYTRYVLIPFLETPRPILGLY
jgi:hypothetical protein